MARVYIGCKMTGLYCDEMLEEAEDISLIFYGEGLDPYHPVLREGIPDIHKKLTERSPEEMAIIWREDKNAIKNAHVVVDTAPHLFSAGLKEEIGKARYRDWKPTVAIYPRGYAVPHISRTERDFVTNSATEAAIHINKLWGTRLRRMRWRLPIYIRNWQYISLAKLWEFFR
jgi:hypothetical protein